VRNPFGWRLTPLKMTMIVIFGLAGELTEEFPFIHAVLESFAAVDEDDGNLVGELAAELIVGVDVHFLPAEQAAAFQLDQTLLDDLAEMAAFSRVNQDIAKDVHEGECSRFGANFIR
jgi:hypothetical protein